MNCPHCNHPGVDDRNYCGACGGLLVQYCRLCGARNQAQDRYCGGCGAPLGGDSLRPPQPAAAAPRPQAATPAPSPAAAPSQGGSGMADLLAAARETEESAQAAPDVKVSQDDIDSLFGD